MWTTQSAETAMQPHQRNGSAHVPAGTLQALSFEPYLVLCCHGHSGGWIEELSGLEHGVHDDSKLSCNSHSRSFEADPLPELKAPSSQGTLFGTARENDRRCFVEKSTQMAIAASGYMAVVIDFAGLVAACGKADPGAHGSRLLKVSRLFNGGSERGCSNCSHARDGHEDAAGLALSGIRDQLAPEVRGASAQTFPSIEKR